MSLCRLQYRELHRRGDDASGGSTRNIDPLLTASALWAQTHPALTRPDLKALLEEERARAHLLAPSPPDDLYARRHCDGGRAARTAGRTHGFRLSETLEHRSSMWGSAALHRSRGGLRGDEKGPRNFAGG